MGTTTNPFSDEQEALMAANDAEVKLPVGYTRAQAMAESSGNPQAVSDKGAVGTFQIMPREWGVVEQRVGRKLDKYNFNDQLLAQKTLMTENMQHFGGDVTKATMAYNGGWTPATWGATQQDYAQKILGNGYTPEGATERRFADPETQVNTKVNKFNTAGAAGMTSIDKQDMYRAGVAPMLDAAIPQMNASQDAVNANHGFNDYSVENSVVAGDAREAAQLSHTATTWETVKHTAQDGWITSKIADAWNRDYDSNYVMSQEQKDMAGKAGVGADPTWSAYVGASTSNSDFEARLARATDGLEYAQRQAQTHGTQGWVNGFSELATGVADPLVVAGTLGLGAGVGLARGAFAAKSAAQALEAVPSLAQGLTRGALEGSAVGVGLTGAGHALDGTQGAWPEYVEQGLIGAGMGALGGMLAAKGAAKAAAKALAKEQASHVPASVKLDGIMGDLGDDHAAAVQRTQDLAGARPASTVADAGMLSADDKTGADPLDLKVGSKGHGDEFTPKWQLAEDRIRAQQEFDAAQIGPDPKPESARPEWETHTVAKPEESLVEHDGAQAPVEEAVKSEEPQIASINFAGDTKNPFLTDEQRTAKPTTNARDELTRLTKEASDPLTRGLAQRLLDQLRNNADITVHAGPGRSHYFTGDNSIHLFPDSARGIADPDNVSLHEISHSVSAAKIEYGINNPNTLHGKLVAQLEQIRKRASREYTGSDENTKYFLGQRDGAGRHEFLAGLYSGQSEFTTFLHSLKVKNGNLLSKSVDVLRSILGIKPKETSALTKAMGLSDHLINEPLKFSVNGEGHVLAAPDSFSKFRDEATLPPEAQKWADRFTAHAEVLPAATAALRARLQKAYDAVRSIPGMTAATKAWTSIGRDLGMSESKAVRFMASEIGEDATGNNRQSGMSAALDSVNMTAAWRVPFTEASEPLMMKLMTDQERKLSVQGLTGEAESRIGRLVHEELQKQRTAHLTNTEYTPHADGNLRALVGLVNGFTKDAAQMGKAVGDAQLAAIHDSGWKGFFPYRFDWRAINRWAQEDIGKFNSFKAVLREQYLGKTVALALEKMKNGVSGPVQTSPEALEALRAQVYEHANTLTDRWLTQMMRSPDERLGGAQDHFAAIAGDLMHEKFSGTKVTRDMQTQFVKELSNVINDRTRTEFDTLAEGPNGFKLLDAMDTDVGSLIQNSSSRYAGTIALAKKGLKDDSDVSAMLTALRRTDGTTDKDVSNLKYMIDGIAGNLPNKDTPVMDAMKSLAHLQMMGKLGLNSLSDLATVTFNSGMTGFARVVKSLPAQVAESLPFIGSKAKTLAGSSRLMKQLAGEMPTLLGMDHDLHAKFTTAGAEGHDGALLANPTLWKNLSTKAGSALQFMNMSGFVHKLAHRAYVPYMAEDVLAAIGGKEGGITPTRLADMGLHPEAVERIRAMLEKHDAGRKVGDGINWAKWEDQVAKDDLQGSMIRSAGQALNRSFVGEKPRWMSETQFGQLIGQFHNYSTLAGEKQLARNLAIGDMNSAVGFTFTTAWGAMLYTLKMQANMAGMDDKARQKYTKENMTGLHAVIGMMTMIGASGIFADGADMGRVLLGGQSQGSSPVAAIGAAQNIMGAVGAAARIGSSAFTGGLNPWTDKPEDYAAERRKVFRGLPLGNTWLGTFAANEATKQ